jgi:Domain of Unknown Function (DUF1080)
MTPIRHRHRVTLCVLAMLVTGASDPVREVVPSPGPRFEPPKSGVLFADDFSHGLGDWQADHEGVWSIRKNLLRADLPDRKQERSFLYGGSEEWTDYALDFDVCAIRGVDKGAAVRVQGDHGIGVDLRGPGYQDVLLHRREWRLGKARVLNANGVWHHVRIEALGHHYRVWVDQALVLDRTDGKKARRQGRIALAAYAGGVGECTVFYDNVIVTRIE